MPDRVMLNDKQEALLRWIADGCPDGVMPDESHRISAAALRNRGLASTSGRGPTWKAKLTPAGRNYLAQLDGAERSEEFEGLAAAVLSEPAPRQLGSRVHSAARDFRERIERHEVSRAQLGRATDLVQAVAAEAEQRGWTVLSARQSENEFGLIDWSSAKDGHFSIDVDEQRFWVRLQEEGVGTRGALEDGDDITYDLEGTGRLKLEVRWGEWFTRQQTRWADRDGEPLEQRLDQIFAEIVSRAGDAQRVAGEKQARVDNAAAQQLAQAQDREHEWAEQMARARERYFDASRADALTQQVSAWEEAQRIRAYCEALLAAHPDDPGVRSWIEWARAHADQIDPLAGAPGSPNLDEPAPAALQPYLPDGWKASGP